MKMLKKLLFMFFFLDIVLSGGIHRVAQSRWNIPNEGSNTILNIYFTLDNDLPVGGIINIGFPFDINYILTTCDVWEIENDLKYPVDDS